MKPNKSGGKRVVLGELVPKRNSYLTLDLDNDGSNDASYWFGEELEGKRIRLIAELLDD